jgi:hypothetical protein
MIAILESTNSAATLILILVTKNENFQLLEGWKLIKIISLVIILISKEGIKVYSS